jgi:hypothetical protein
MNGHIGGATRMQSFWLAALLFLHCGDEAKLERGAMNDILTDARKAVRMTPLKYGNDPILRGFPGWTLPCKGQQCTLTLNAVIWRASPNW